jgi:uncharacterized protein (TIGR02596 family)
MKSPFRPRSAFSLIEMLMVIAIIGIIASFAIPGAMKMIRGTDVARGSQMLSDQLTAARQMAIARNKQIEIRFLRFADPETPGESVAEQGTWKIRGLQLMEVTGSGIPVQLAPIQRLPGAMMLNEGRYSSLFDATGNSQQIPLRFKNPSDLDPGMPRLPSDKARKYTYASFRFYPDGSTSLSPTGNWYMTMHSSADTARLSGAVGGGPDPIKSVNYFTLQVDPVSGSTRVYRPQLGS